MVEELGELVAEPTGAVGWVVDGAHPPEHMEEVQVVWWVFVAEREALVTMEVGWGSLRGAKCLLREGPAYFQEGGGE